MAVLESSESRADHGTNYEVDDSVLKGVMIVSLSQNAV